MPWLFSPLIWATKPTPHASCSFAPAYRPCSCKWAISAAVVMARTSGNSGKTRGYCTAAALPSKIIGVRFQLPYAELPWLLNWGRIKCTADRPPRLPLHHPALRPALQVGHVVGLAESP